MNTVHVRDVVRALWHLRDAGPPGQIYNLADKGETSESIFSQTGNNLVLCNCCIIFTLAQGIISELVSRLFDIEHGYHGSVISNLAKVNSPQKFCSLLYGLQAVIELPLTATHGWCN